MCLLEQMALTPGPENLGMIMFYEILPPRKRISDFLAVENMEGGQAKSKFRYINRIYTIVACASQPCFSMSDYLLS